MTDHSRPTTSTAGVRTHAPGVGHAESKLVSYARLANLDVYDYYLSVLVVLAAFALSGAAWQSRTPLTLVLFLVGEVCVVVALVAFDDITGYRDGSDTANYAPDAAARRMRRKPLVAGTLSERDALTFAWTMALLGGALWAAAIVLAPHRPVWAIVVAAGTYAFSLQYSYGLKLSYHGFQELILVGLGWALVVAPYGLITGWLPAFVQVLAVLFGIGPLMFGVYSNTNDIPGDRSVDRITVATITTPHGNRRFIAVLSAVELLIAVAAAAGGVAPWWFVVFVLPVAVLRVCQYRIAFHHDNVLRARRLGVWTHRLSTVLLVGAALLAGIGGRA